MFGFLKKKKAPPPKKVKKPVDIKKVSAQYKVVLKQERFRKDVRQIKEKNVIDFHNLRYYLQKQKPHLYRKKYKVIERRKVLREWFNLLDSDSSGEIEVEELAIPLISLGFARNYAEVVRIIEAVDDDGSGTLGCDEFISIVEGRAGVPQPKGKKEGKKSNTAGQAVLQLLHALQSGDIGDPKHTSLELLISNYKRKKMMNGLLAYGRSDLDKNTKTKYRQMLTSLAVMSESHDNEHVQKRQSLYIGNDVNPLDAEDQYKESIIKKSDNANDNIKKIKTHIPHVNTILKKSKKFNNRGHFTANIEDYSIYNEKKLAARVNLNLRTKH